MRRGRVLAALAGVIVVAVLVVAGFRPDTSPALDAPTADPVPARGAPTHTSEPERQPIGTTDETTDDSEDDAVVGVLVVWARGGLPPDAAGTALALPDVVAVSQLRSDVVGLLATRDADGNTVQAFTDGFQIPVTAVAVDPASHRAYLDDEAADALGDLAPGRVLLSETSVELRGIGVGGHVDLDGAPDLEVVAIVPDRVARGAEVLLDHADADALGVAPGGALFVAHRADDAGVADLVAGLEALIPDGASGRVVGGDSNRVPLVLSMLEVKRLFGEFAYRPRSGDRGVDIDPAWVEQHIVEARMPLLGTVRCHEAIIDDLRSALEEIEAAGLGGWIDPRAYGGCFLARHISTERERLSKHSWGIAIDINVDQSLPGLGPVPPDGIIDAFGRHGFRWGGDFATPDNHHWEWVGEIAMTRPDRP